jgi:hypothetical protein
VRDVGRRGRANLLALAVEARHNRLIRAESRPLKDSEVLSGPSQPSPVSPSSSTSTAPLLLPVVISVSLRGPILSSTKETGVSPLRSAATPTRSFSTPTPSHPFLDSD